MSEHSLNLPESVAAWLTDSAVRMAVNALLELDWKSLPEELEWRELRDYHTARAAAELTRSEWVIALQDAWQEVWGNQINSDWLIWSPAQLLEDDNYITVDATWRENAFTVVHERRELLLFTAIEFEPHVTKILFGLEPKDDDWFLVEGKPERFAWRTKAKEPWWQWNMLSVPGNLATNAELLHDLIASAGEALTVCEAAAAGYQKG